MRVTAFLRLPLIALIGLLVWTGTSTTGCPACTQVVLGVYAAAAVVWLVVVLRGPVPRWADWTSTAFDVLVVVVLCLVSGGATAALLPVFFLLPIAVAFQDRPMLTAILGTGTALCYLAVWIVYSKRDDTVGMPDIVYTHFGFLLWAGGGDDRAVLGAGLAPGARAKLQEVRRQLVSEAMQADERHNRESRRASARRPAADPVGRAHGARRAPRTQRTTPRSKPCMTHCSRPPRRCARR